MILKEYKNLITIIVGILFAWFFITLINGEIKTVVLAENTSISDIPRVSYIIKSTETEIIPIIPTFVDFDPDTLNLKSKGQDIAVYIELPKGYDIHQIDLATLKLNDQISPRLKPIEFGDYDHNGIPDLMIKFDRKSVQSILTPGDKVKITISGKSNDGRLFEGSDTIRVIDAKTTAFLLFPILLGLTGLIDNKRKKFGLSRKNKSRGAEGKTIIWVIILTIVFLGLGFSVYQWWTTKEKLLNQIKKNEEMIKKIKTAKENSNCIKKIPLPSIEFGFTVALTAFRGDITLTRPDGSGKVGRWWDNEMQEFVVAAEGFGGTGYGVADPGGKNKPPSVACFSGMMPRDEGDFLVEVLKQPNTLSSDTYTLELWVGGELEVVLAENVPFGNFPKHLYIIRSTKEGITVINPNACQL